MKFDCSSIAAYERTVGWMNCHTPDIILLYAKGEEVGEIPAIRNTVELFGLSCEPVYVESGSGEKVVLGALVDGNRFVAAHHFGFLRMDGKDIIHDPSSPCINAAVERLYGAMDGYPLPPRQLCETLNGFCAERFAIQNTESGEFLCEMLILQTPSGKEVALCDDGKTCSVRPGRFWEEDPNLDAHALDDHSIRHLLEKQPAGMGV